MAIRRKGSFWEPRRLDYSPQDGDIWFGETSARRWCRPSMLSQSPLRPVVTRGCPESGDEGLRIEAGERCREVLQRAPITVCSRELSCRNAAENLVQHPKASGSTIHKGFLIVANLCYNPPLIHS